ncbi:hypothetical protein [Agromyces humatus]|uniref:DUF4230 domain-containing protein n=1 Tax=Agromyces humatus TaxID=279573 RepID=A0ABN2KYL4_9MICO|nr:hypothetical protein [Agromyces humatus]
MKVFGRAVKAFFTKRVLLWPILLLVGCVVAFGVFMTTAGASFALAGLSAFGTESESRDTQVIESVSRQEEVVLLGLGIQGISRKGEKSTLFGADVPGSERASFIQYTFDAKLGIDGSDVRIEPIGEGSYLITIPEFIFIGHDSEGFELIAEQNGVLSWITPEIDAVEMINDILDDELQDEYVESNQEVLRDQAEAFYKGIILGVDPNLTVKFKFEG